MLTVPNTTSQETCFLERVTNQLWQISQASIPASIDDLLFQVIYDSCLTKTNSFIGSIIDLLDPINEPA